MVSRRKTPNSFKHYQITLVVLPEKKKKKWWLTHNLIPHRNTRLLPIIEIHTFLLCLVTFPLLYIELTSYYREDPRLFIVLCCHMRGAGKWIRFIW